MRIERLQDISQEDARAEGVTVVSQEMREAPDFDKTMPWHVEGVPNSQGMRPREAFAALWDGINAQTYPWKSNPWVAVIEFHTIHGNILQQEAA